MSTDLGVITVTGDEQPPGVTAAYGRYDTKQDRRRLIAALHALVPAGACVFDMIDVEPGEVRGDPMKQYGFAGLKWEAPHV
jgi:hypothetical protein